MTDNSAMTGDEFKRARTLMGMSQAAIAKALGISDRTIIRYEQGKSAVPITTAITVRHMLVKGKNLDDGKAITILLNVCSWLKSTQQTAQLLEVAFGRVSMPGVKCESVQESGPCQCFRLIVPVAGKRPTLSVQVRTAPSAAPVTIAGALITALEVQAIDNIQGEKK